MDSLHFLSVMTVKVLTMLLAFRNCIALSVFISNLHIYFFIVDIGNSMWLVFGGRGEGGPQRALRDLCIVEPAPAICVRVLGHVSYHVRIVQALMLSQLRTHG